MDLGSYHGLSVRLTIEDDSITAGTNTVPGVMTLRNDNTYPATELEGHFNSKLNIMPSNFSFARISPGSSKDVHLLVSVPKSTQPGDYDITVAFDFRIDTPPATSKALVIEVVPPTE
jgi:uncharacterized membrane protein